MELLPKQQKFTFDVQYNPHSKFIWYVGGFGSGKSFIGAYNAILLSLRFPKNRGLIARQTLVDCKNTTQKTFFEVLDEEFKMKEGEHYRFDRHEQRLFFFNGENGAEGSEIIFSGLDEISKIKGMELGWFWIDEVDEVKEEVFKILAKGRLRLKGIERRVGFITSNSEGKNWTYQIFINGKGLDSESHKRYYTMRASSLENKFLPKDYIQELLTMEGTLYDRYVLGEFNVFEGQIYDNFDPGTHVVRPFEIPPDRTTIYGLDHGSANPTAILEIHCNYDGELFVTWERYEPNRRIEEHAMAMEQRMKLLRKWNPHPESVCDPSLFYKTQMPTADKPFPWAIAETYRENGIHFIPANNSVIAGIDLVKQYLHNKKLYIFDTCTNLIDEMQGYKRAKKSDGESAEVPVKKNDHACDALRYILMTKFPPPSKLKHSTPQTIQELVAQDIQDMKNGTIFEKEANFE